MPPVFLRRAAAFAALALATFAAAAPTPWELNMDRVAITDPKGLAAPTYFVPGVNLIVSCSGSVWAQSKKGGANAQAKGKFYVQGLDRALLQGLARQVQDDLVAKLRATGAKVLTYDDLKDDPLLSGHGRRSPDPKWGLPTSSGFSSLTFVTAAPSDAQAFESGITGPLFWLRGMAKERNLVVILPEITFTVPQMWGETASGYQRDSAGIAVNSTMLLQGAMIYVTNPRASFTHIQIQTHGKRYAAEVTGTVRKLSEDVTHFSSSWGRSSSDWVLLLDPAAFSDGILRVGYAIDSMIADQVKKARK
jgi:hypothetical protein